MTLPRWIVKGPRSELVFVTTPDAKYGAKDAVMRLDRGRAGRGPDAVPGWLRTMRRYGYWWYPICMAVTAIPFYFFSDRGIGFAVAMGIAVGATTATVSGAVLVELGKLQVRRQNRREAEETTADLFHQVRETTVPLGCIRSVLAKKVADKEELHRLVWRASGDVPEEQEAALSAIGELWNRADPRAAAAYEGES